MNMYSIRGGEISGVCKNLPVRMERAPQLGKGGGWKGQPGRAESKPAGANSTTTPKKPGSYQPSSQSLDFSV